MKTPGENPLLDRSDVQKLAGDLFRSILPAFSAGGSRVNLGPNISHYSDAIAELEGYARPLWGLAPLLAGDGGESAWAELYRAGMAHGSDQTDPEYWGVLTDKSQMAVEMAPLAFALLLDPDRFWLPLSGDVRLRLATWLRQINHVSLVDNNWLFFRVLVNLALQKHNLGHDARLMVADLTRLDEFYLGDGWYYDGANKQRDYYVSFAFHYYGLLYAKFNQTADPERSHLYRERATLFARDFVHWFAANGEAIPYGRSLTYRFAQTAFWGALAWSETPVFSWGCLKGLLLRNLRWWLRQPIFTESGKLSIGYCYDHPAFGESYNSPASPYWAFKCFLPLALPEEHPFWQAKEEAFPDLSPVRAMPHPAMVLMHDPETGNATALCGGQNPESQFRHSAEKFSKFAYATHFGFNVSSSNQGIRYQGMDGMLCFSRDGRHFCMRDKSTGHIVGQNMVSSQWQAGELATVQTFLVACPPWHVRLHLVQNNQPVQTWEGGFALAKGHRNSRISQVGISRIDGDQGTSLIINCSNQRYGIVCAQDYGLNSHHPRTEIPVLYASLPAGRHLLVCAVQASSRPIPANKSLPPIVKIQPTLITIEFNGTIFPVPISAHLFDPPLSLPARFYKFSVQVKNDLLRRLASTRA